jgi:hypothetical protein
VFPDARAGNTPGTTEEENAMTEQQNTPRPADDEGSHASVGKDADRAGGGRTEGETAVDDALGQDPPAE